jgi:hypothetical protein
MSLAGAPDVDPPATTGGHPHQDLPPLLASFLSPAVVLAWNGLFLVAWTVWIMASVPGYVEGAGALPRLAGIGIGVVALSVSAGIGVAIAVVRLVRRGGGRSPQRGGLRSAFVNGTAAAWLGLAPVALAGIGLLVADAIGSS